MRRAVLHTLLGGLLLFVLLCGAGIWRVWSRQGLELIMPGAGDTQIERRGFSRLHITYRLPINQTRQKLRLFLLGQGWRRISFSNLERDTTMTFIRAGWPSQVREILVITIDPHRARVVDMQFGRCMTLGSRVTCF